VFRAASNMETQTPYRSPTAALAGRYSRLDGGYDEVFFLLHPIHFKPTEPVSAQHQIPSKEKENTTASFGINKPFHQIHHPSTLLQQATTNPTTTHNPTMTNTMPGAYDPALYPNLMRYRNSQPAIVSPRPANGIPRHPLESLPGDEWRRCPLCWSSKICVVVGRCVYWGRRVKVVVERE